LDTARTAGTRFRIARHPDLRILRFEDESLVFNPVLWHTHFLNASGTLILDCLDEAPATAGELTEALCDEEGNPALPIGQIEQMLSELEALGIVERDIPGTPA
jgi:PqqD family protein of HPr-rel-A system